MVEGWNYSLLSSVCEEITSGGAAPQGDKYFINGRYPFVRVVDMGNLQGKKLMSQTRDMINDDGAVKLRLFPKGTILFTKSGASLLLNQRAILNEPMFVVSHIGCLIPNENVTSDWLYYWMKTVDFNVYAHATTLPSLKLTTIKGLTIPVPPIPEQERIVARIEELFSQLDAGVETLKKTKAQLAIYRQTAITEAFSAENNTPNVCLSDIAQIIGGITKGRDLSGMETIELPYLRVANVQNGYLDLSEIKTIVLRVDEKERYLLKPGDVLYTEGGDRDKLGRGTVWRGEIEDCVHQNHIFKARIDQSKAIPEYVAFWSMSTPARNYFYQKGKQSVNLASINKTVLSALTLPLPALEKQREIVNRIDFRLSVCDSIEHTVDTALQQAEAMRQSILKQAFEGGL